MLRIGIEAESATWVVPFETVAESEDAHHIAARQLAKGAVQPRGQKRAHGVALGAAIPLTVAHQHLPRPVPSPERNRRTTQKLHLVAPGVGRQACSRIERLL